MNSGLLRNEHGLMAFRILKINFSIRHLPNYRAVHNHSTHNGCCDFFITLKIPTCPYPAFYPLTVNHSFLVPTSAVLSPCGYSQFPS